MGLTAIEARNEWRRLKRDLRVVQKLIRSVGDGSRTMLFEGSRMILFKDGLRILAEQEAKLQKRIAEIEGLFK